MASEMIIILLAVGMVFSCTITCILRMIEKNERKTHPNLPVKTVWSIGMIFILIFGCLLIAALN
jgi:glucose uptake protein GlcU